MKIENTPVNKAKFFALYEGQNVLHHPEASCPMGFGELCGMMGREEIEPSGFDKTYAKLRPLSDITDEEAIEAANICGFKFKHVIRTEDSVIVEKFKRKYDPTSIIIYFDGLVDGIPYEDLTGGTYVDVYDYLRSRGFALSFMGVSVETLIKWGWVKIKEND